MEASERKKKAASFAKKGGWNLKAINPWIPAYDLIGDARYLDLATRWSNDSDIQETLEHPEGRKLIFVGDLMNRGPDSVGVLKTVRETWEQGNASLS